MKWYYTFIVLKKISIFLMKKIDFWIYVASTEFPGGVEGSTWEVPPKLTQILSVRPTYTSTFIFTFKKRKTNSFFFMVLSICNFFRIKKSKGKSSESDWYCLSAWFNARILWICWYCSHDNKMYWSQLSD